MLSNNNTPTPDNQHTGEQQSSGNAMNSTAMINQKMENPYVNSENELDELKTAVKYLTTYLTHLEKQKNETIERIQDLEAECKEIQEDDEYTVQYLEKLLKKRKRMEGKESTKDSDTAIKIIDTEIAKTSKTHEMYITQFQDFDSEIKQLENGLGNVSKMSKLAKDRREEVNTQIKRSTGFLFPYRAPTKKVTLKILTENNNSEDLQKSPTKTTS